MEAIKTGVYGYVRLEAKVHQHQREMRPRLNDGPVWDAQHCWGGICSDILVNLTFNFYFRNIIQCPT